MKSPNKSPLGSRIAAQVVIWFFLLLVLGTVFGVWVKLFWLGWVFVR